uniref:Cytochrome c domain-containing protein n=1 Tax=Colletotrichum fructicola (strain Nara gc5) TaxID=1213859 RepID=L2FS03_COLFN
MASTSLSPPKALPEAAALEGLMAIKCPNGPHIPTEEDLEKQNLFKVTCSECHERVVRMAQIFSKTCPNSDSGYGPLTYGIVRDMAAGIRLGGCNLDIANMMTYQWKMGQLADRAVKNFGLPAPSNENCIMWDFGSIDIACQTRSQKQNELGSLQQLANQKFLQPQVSGPQPESTQGYYFGRFIEYLSAARLPINETEKLVEGVKAYVNSFTHLS